MQNGFRKASVSNAAQQFYRLFFRINRPAHTSEPTSCRRAVSSTRRHRERRLNSHVYQAASESCNNSIGTSRQTLNGHSGAKNSPSWPLTDEHEASQEPHNGGHATATHRADQYATQEEIGNTMDPIRLAHTQAAKLMGEQRSLDQNNCSERHGYMADLGGSKRTWASKTLSNAGLATSAGIKTIADTQASQESHKFDSIAVKGSPSHVGDDSQYMAPMTSVVNDGAISPPPNRPDAKFDALDDIQRLRFLMRHMPSSVTLVTTCAPEYQETSTRLEGTQSHKRDSSNDRPDADIDPFYRAMTVSSFTTVSLEHQPVVSFNVKTPSRTLDGLMHWQQFLVHIFDGTEESARLVHAFTQGDSTQGFRYAARGALICRPHCPTAELPNPTRAPKLRHSSVVAVLTCRILKTVSVADHEVVFAGVRMVEHPTDRQVDKSGSTTSFEGLMYHDRAYKRPGEALFVPHAEKSTKT